MDRLGIKEFKFSENRYRRNDDEIYEVSDLIELAKDLKPFDLDIRGIDISFTPWGEYSLKGFCYHVQRMNKIKGEHHIILDDTGYICDGWHRLAKAIIEGKETIKAVRLTVMPDKCE